MSAHFIQNHIYSQKIISKTLKKCVGYAIIFEVNNAKEGGTFNA